MLNEELIKRLKEFRQHYSPIALYTLLDEAADALVMADQELKDQKRNVE